MPRLKTSGAQARGSKRQADIASCLLRLMRLSRIELKFLKRGVYCIFDIAYSGNNPNPALQVPPIILQANIVVPQM